MKQNVYLHQHQLFTTAGLTTEALLAHIAKPQHHQINKTLPESTRPFFKLAPLKLPDLEKSLLDETDEQQKFMCEVSCYLDALLKPWQNTPENQTSAAIFLGSSSFLGKKYEKQFPRRGAPPQTELADLIIEKLGVKIPISSFSTGCTSSIHALKAAYQMIACGAINDALVLGIEFESSICQAGFDALGMLAPQEIRPFCAQREGMILSEGMVAIHLSNQQSAWRIADVDYHLNPHNIAGLDDDGHTVTKLWERMLTRVKWQPNSIDWIKVQASGSALNDRIEGLALQDFFEQLPRLISLKPYLGHALGASGLVELIALKTLIDHQVFPKNFGFSAIDADINIDLCALSPSEGNHKTPQRILSNIIGFGSGIASVLIEHTPEFV